MNHMLETMERIFPNDANGHEKARVLFDLARNSPYGHIVEVGSSIGAGTIPLALGSLAGVAAPVYAVDTNDARGWANEQYTPDMRVAFYRNLIDAGVAHMVNVVQIDQGEMAASDLLDGIGLLFFDLGRRLDEQIGGALLLWSLAIDDDGAIAINETGNHDLGVDKFVAEAMPEWEVVDIRNRIRILRRR